MKINNSKLMLLMANASLSASDLSALSGVNEVTICRIRKGNQTARLKTLGKIAKALDCKVEDFVMME